jgi:chorismate mutase / prephenate dehydrogenase
MTKLDKLRRDLNEVDSGILKLIQRRQAICLEIGREKRSMGRPTRDWQREREVLDRINTLADQLGLPNGLAEQIIKEVIQASLQVQERDQVSARAAGGGRTCLLIGGAGQMGRWFARFLESQGYSIEIADPAGPVLDYPYCSDWTQSALDQDLILVATSLSHTDAILQQLAVRKPAGLVVEIASLKTPLRASLQRLAAADVRIASLHPMFGPTTELLSGRHVICVDLGAGSAHGAGAEIFASTMARCVTMGLDDHDKLMASVLGMSHAINIAFFSALAESGSSVPELASISSTTFDAQLQVATAVSKDNAELYFEIQSLNEYGIEALNTLEKALGQLKTSVIESDKDAFVNLMENGRAYLSSRRLAHEG